MPRAEAFLRVNKLGSLTRRCGKRERRWICETRRGDERKSNRKGEN